MEIKRKRRDKRHDFYSNMLNKTLLLEWGERERGPCSEKWKWEEFRRAKGENGPEGAHEPSYLLCLTLGSLLLLFFFSLPLLFFFFFLCQHHEKENPSTINLVKKKINNTKKNSVLDPRRPTQHKHALEVYRVFFFTEFFPSSPKKKIETR